MILEKTTVLVVLHIVLKKVQIIRVLILVVQHLLVLHRVFLIQVQAIHIRKKFSEVLISMFSTLQIVKTLISAFIILLAIEISNKSTLIAAIIIALPLVSIISLTWIWLETKDIEKISDLSTQIFWFVIPGLPMFLLLPILLNKGIGFYVSMVISCGVTVILFYIMQRILS